MPNPVAVLVRDRVQKVDWQRAVREHHLRYTTLFEEAPNVAIVQIPHEEVALAAERVGLRTASALQRERLGVLRHAVAMTTHGWRVELEPAALNDAGKARAPRHQRTASLFARASPPAHHPFERKRAHNTSPGFERAFESSLTFWWRHTPAVSPKRPSSAADQPMIGGSVEHPTHNIYIHFVTPVTRPIACIKKTIEVRLAAGILLTRIRRAALGGGVNPGSRLVVPRDSDRRDGP